MNIKDFVNEVEPEEKNHTPDSLDLEEIEKTAELLDVFATEDTLLDEMAKLAVLQDLAKLHSSQK